MAAYSEDGINLLSLMVVAFAELRPDNQVN